MKHVNKYLSLALALVLCLSLAACGESNEDYGDDGSDYNLYGVPDSFEGLVKDSEQMANLYIYGGAWTGEDGGTLYVAELGTFTKVTGDAPGENTGDIDFEMMAGIWYLDAEADARSILVFDENGGWELLERPGGDGDPTTVDSGTIELAPEDAEEMYLAVSDLYDQVVYEFTLLDHDTVRWGSEFEFYQKMA